MTWRFSSKFVLLELGDRWAVTVLSSVVCGVFGLGAFHLATAGLR